MSKTQSVWPSCRFGDIANFRNGLNFTQSSRGQLVKVVGVGDFGSAEVLTDFSQTSLITVNGELSDEDLLRDGDLLFVRSNGNKALVGRCVYVQPNGNRVTFSGFTIRARITSDDADPWFISKVVRSPLFKEALYRLGGGSSINNLSQGVLSEFEFPLPPLREQRKIAEILRTWDDGIRAYERLITAKLSRINALSSKFFMPCHPTFEGRPTTWQRFELGEVFAERDEQGTDNDVLLSITMSGGVIDREDVGRKNTSNDDKSAYKLILPGDIGYNTMRMWQGVSGLSKLRGIVSPAYTIVTPDNRNIAARYAAHLFKSRRMVFDFERYSQGLTSDTWNLKFPAFARIVVYLPSMDIQLRQADLLDVLSLEIAALEKQRDAITKQKRGLMQKLLTGEWRVNLEGKR
jgi:type I restriction enzyme S subunit